MGRILPRRGCAVMTYRASALDLRVVNAYHRPPYRRGMTSSAQIGSGDMRRIFTGSNNAVMARFAATKHLVVIDTQRAPTHRRVALVTYVG